MKITMSELGLPDHITTIYDSIPLEDMTPQQLRNWYNILVRHGILDEPPTDAEIKIAVERLLAAADPNQGDLWEDCV